MYEESSDSVQLLKGEEEDSFFLVWVVVQDMSERESVFFSSVVGWFVEEEYIEFSIGGKRVVEYFLKSF